MTKRRTHEQAERAKLWHELKMERKKQTRRVENDLRAIAEPTVRTEHSHERENTRRRVKVSSGR